MKGQINRGNKMEKQERRDSIIKIIDRLGSTLNFTVEDKRTIRVMVNAFFRKRTGTTNSDDGITAAAFLWQYSERKPLAVLRKRWKLMKSTLMRVMEWEMLISMIIYRKLNSIIRKLL